MGVTLFFNGWNYMNYVWVQSQNWSHGKSWWSILDLWHYKLVEYSKNTYEQLCKIYHCNIFSAKFQDLHLENHDEMTSPLQCHRESKGSSPPTRWRRWRPRMNSCMLPFLCLPHPNGLSSVHQFDAPGPRVDFWRMFLGHQKRHEKPSIGIVANGLTQFLRKFMADI